MLSFQCVVDAHLFINATILSLCCEGKGREGKGREEKGREGKGREMKGSEGKGSEGKAKKVKGSEGKIDGIALRLSWFRKKKKTIDYRSIYRERKRERNKCRNKSNVSTI